MKKTFTLPIMEINRDIYDLLESGKKKIETRGGGPKYENISTGDIVIIECGEDSFEREVKDLKKFKTIEEMLDVYSVKDIDPRISNVEELKKLYSSFPGYKERIQKYGLIVFEI